MIAKPAHGRPPPGRRWPEAVPDDRGQTAVRQPAGAEPDADDAAQDDRTRPEPCSSTSKHRPAYGCPRTTCRNRNRRPRAGKPAGRPLVAEDPPPRPAARRASPAGPDAERHRTHRCRQQSAAAALQDSANVSRRSGIGNGRTPANGRSTASARSPPSRRRRCTPNPAHGADRTAPTREVVCWGTARQVHIPLAMPTKNKRRTGRTREREPFLENAGHYDIAVAEHASHVYSVVISRTPAATPRRRTSSTGPKTSRASAPPIGAVRWIERMSEPENAL